MPDHLIIDQAAVDARKPRAGPMVEPAEAIAIALSSAQWQPARLYDPEGELVQHIMDAVKRAGWKFEPR